MSAAAPGASRFLHDLVAMPSPTGHERDAVAWLQDQARSDGFRVRADAAGNFLAEAGRGDRLLLFAGHVDTVPGDIPVRVEDGVLWGRGSVDAKGSLAAAYLAARERLDDPDLRVLVAGLVDEEGASRGARMLDPGGRPDWIVVGEPSGADGITITYKGLVRGTARFARPAVHGGHPDPNGLDAAHAWWAQVRDGLDAGTGFDAVQARLDGMDHDSNGLRDEATVHFQLRLPPAVAPGDAAKRLHALTGQAGADVRLRLGEQVPAAQGDPRSPLVAAFRAAIREGGGRPRLLRKTGTADFNLLAQRYPSTPIAAYGPGDSSLDHAPDERLTLAELERSVAVWRRVLDRLAGQANPAGPGWPRPA